MRKFKVVLSLFDGISCAQAALNRAGCEYETYYASEIEPAAIAITQGRYPNTIQLGDIRNLDPSTLPFIDLVTCGSPCGDLSIAGTRRGMVTIEQVEVTSLEQYLELKESGFQFKGQSYLFWEAIRVLRGIKFRDHIIENVATMSSFWLNLINRELGMSPLKINSSIVTVQNRNRYYWSTLPWNGVPKNVTFDSIIPGAQSAGVHGVSASKHKDIPNPNNVKWVQKLTVRKDGKSNCLTTSGSTRKYVKDGKVFNLSPEECEIIQTLDVGHTNIKGIPKTAKLKAIGNGWSVDTIVPFFI